MDKLKKIVSTFSDLYKETFARSHHDKALRQLEGRALYFHPSHIKVHKTRIQISSVLHDGLYFLVVASEENRDGKRGMFWAIFDTLGNTTYKSEPTPRLPSVKAYEQAQQWAETHLTAMDAIHDYQRHAQRHLYQAAQDYHKAQIAVADLAEAEKELRRELRRKD